METKCRSPTAPGAQLLVTPTPSVRLPPVAARHRCLPLLCTGITIVSAAGNEGVDLATSAPAMYPEVLTVTAMADSDGKPGGCS
jgi:hypothetical protein